VNGKNHYFDTHIKACTNEDPGVCGEPLGLKGLYRVHLDKMCIFHL
jgi:hypothetical protein